MKRNKNFKLTIIVLLLITTLLTGCTKTLTDKNKKAVKNEVTGQNLTENILCKPTDKATLKLYKKNNVNTEKLPDCNKFKVTTGKYEGLWTSIFVKPLAYILLLFGRIFNSYALSLILISITIRLIAYPFTKKTAMQSELMKKAQPEIQKIQNKYKDKQDKDSVTKQSAEMLAIYKKYNMNPMSGCLFSFIQLPLFIAFFEAVQRTPAIFEENFIGFQLGTTPIVGITSATWFMYLALMLLIAFTTYYSFKMNMTGNTMDESMKSMPLIMSGMIIITALFMPSALGLYWVTNNLFTMLQNYLVRKESDNK